MHKRIRIGIAVVFYICINLLFFGIGSQWWGWMAKIQFLPSCLALNFAVVGGILLLTLVFGRIYCSVICPMGVFQDSIIWLRRHCGLELNKLMVRRMQKARAEKVEMPKFKPYVKHFGWVEEKKWLRYGVLALTIAAIVAGIQVFVALIAPYSAYGRMVSTMVEHTGAAMAVLAGATFVLIFVCAWFWGRAWCNNICPVGTVLGLVSRFALFRPVIDPSKCGACGRCYRGCKSSCIDGDHHRIDYSRCVDCFDCLVRCKDKAISYKYTGLHLKPAAHDDTPKNDGCPADEGRRAFIATTAFLCTSLAFSEKKTLAMPSAKPTASAASRVVPAGSGSIRNFYDHCTGCQLCVSSCPGDVLRPSTDLEHFMQPKMVFNKSYCKPDCNVCSQVCPAGAILPLALEEKSRVKIGMARVDSSLCLAANGEAACGNCARKCPQNAIEMATPEGEKNARPVVNPELCVGCGACERYCPARPLKAIAVQGLEIHIKKS